MPRCLIALGSNVGDRAATLDAAVDQLRQTAGCSNVVASDWLETDPIGGPESQDPFLNGAAAFDATLDPNELLDLLLAIERSAGRERRIRWGPRTLDLDVLLYGDAVIRSPRLQTPHPRMSFRRFVMAPAATIAPAMRHPEIGWTLRGILEHLERAPHEIALFCQHPKWETQLVSQASEALGKSPCRIAAFDEATVQSRPTPRLVVLVGEQTWGEAQHRRITELGCGPRLLLSDADSPERWVGEIVAAAAAMH